MTIKKSYHRIDIFLILLLIILGINSFAYDFLNGLKGYMMIVFLVALLVIFKIFFGFEKDRHRHTKDVIINLIIQLLSFFILYYLLGIIITFARNAGYYSLYGFTFFTLRLFIYIILREILRYQILNKCEGDVKSNILLLIVFVLFDITTNIYYHSFDDKYNIFMFFALYFLPALSNNFLATYLSKKTGYKPAIFFMSVIILYPYILPIIPNPNKYITSVVNFIFPLYLLYKQYDYFKKEKDENPERNYKKKSIPLLLISSVITIILVYFTSGYFKYHAVAVASDSMKPAIDKGDVVIIKRIDNQYKIIKKGDVIAFEYSNVIIIHRVVNIVHDRGEYFFYTKGDNNKENDNFVIKEEMVEGIVENKIPFIGFPTVWINEL
ncbi:MAG: signal peptidase I [Bacilli bacterium]|nr:signal peptidase I [Bacilli bacterium]